MAKVTIKPLRSFHHGDTVYSENKPVKAEADDAAWFVHNGWAEEVKGKVPPAAAQPESPPPATPPEETQDENGLPESTDGE